MQDEAAEHVKNVVDALSIATVVATIMDILPSVAALLSIVWTIIRIWETKTIQNLLGRSDDHD